MITKKQLIQEGILQGVKDNWDKGLIALGGIYAANKGLMGPDAQKAIQAGGTITKNFVHKAGDWSKDAVQDAKESFEKSNPSLSHASETNNSPHESFKDFQKPDFTSSQHEDTMKEAFKDATKDIKISDNTPDSPDTSDAFNIDSILGGGLEGQ